MYRHFEHVADIGIVGEGATIEKAFQEAAKAMFAVMADINKIEPKKTVNIAVMAENEEELLVEWLNALLTERDIKQMVFSRFDVKISGFKLIGTAYGEKIDHEKHDIRTEVKAATYSQLKIKKAKGKVTVQCIVDV